MRVTVKGTYQNHWIINCFNLHLDIISLFLQSFHSIHGKSQVYWFGFTETLGSFIWHCQRCLPDFNFGRLCQWSGLNILLGNTYNKNISKDLVFQSLVSGILVSDWILYDSIWACKSQSGNGWEPVHLQLQPIMEQCIDLCLPTNPPNHPHLVWVPHQSETKICQSRGSWIVVRTIQQNQGRHF